MKPQDCTYPYTYKKRYPLYQEGLFFVPSNYPEELQKEPQWESTLQKQSKVYVELCSGNGSWILEKAKRVPGCWIAVEKRFDRAKKIYSKRCNQKLEDLLTVCGEAQVFVKHYLKNDSVDQLFINFPDPWPKRRHQKNKLIKISFVKEILRVLKPKGVFTFVTDDQDYMDLVLSLFLQHSEFKPHFQAPYYIQDPENYGESFFKALWEKKGRSILLFEGSLA